MRAQTTSRISRLVKGWGLSSAEVRSLLSILTPNCYGVLWADATNLNAGTTSAGILKVSPSR